MEDRVTVIVPAYNEAKFIPEILRPLAKWKLINPEKHHVVIVNDGSTDSTKEVVENLNREFSFPVIEHIWSDPLTRSNQGKGKAFVAGAFRAKEHGADILVTLDADLHCLRSQDITSFVNELKARKEPMAIAKCIECEGVLGESLAGIRAIRVKALEPLFKGNEKWHELIHGFALERALNYLIRKRFRANTQFHQSVPFRTATSEKQTKDFRNFDGKVEQRNYLSRLLASVIGLKVRNGRITQEKMTRQKRLENIALAKEAKKRYRHSKIGL